MLIYAIRNNINGKLYFGQHAGEDLDLYWKHNVRAALAGRGNKLFLYRAIRKYGPDSFSIFPILKVDSKEELDRYEIQCISYFHTQDENVGYNITAGGGGRLGTKNPHTEEFKKNMSERLRGKKRSKEWADNISKAQKGKTLTPQHIEALKAGQKGCKKPPRTEEHKRRLIESRKRNRLLKLALLEEENNVTN